MIVNYRKRGMLHQEIFTAEIDYSHLQPIVVKNMPQITNAREIGVKIFFDDKLVC